MIRDAIARVVGGETLTRDEAHQVMEEIMTGEATPAQFGALVTALRMRGETVDEVAGFAAVMRAKALPVHVDGPLVDTCGTGGDASGTFNISTAAAIVAAGAGARVAKHGNRAMTSQCGSADVLEGLGVKLDLTPEQVARCIETVGIGFMFAQAFHPAMRFAGPPRREIGIRTVFNILGPLTNPAGAQHQLIGVGHRELVPKLAEVLRQLGARHALVVHGLDGMDEISISAPTLVQEFHDGAMRQYELRPEDLGFATAPRDAIAGGDIAHNVAVIRRLFTGGNGPARAVVLLNAAAAVRAAGLAPSLEAALPLAERSLDSGAAAATLERLITFTWEVAA
ncbi:MAG: anthranilate phosphoribosyltransferase [Chloroflexi bacterium]|nr:anthranilate phosphoribosyltransferase [Chloroflexota bacterium]